QIPSRHGTSCYKVRTAGASALPGKVPHLRRGYPSRTVGGSSKRQHCPRASSAGVTNASSGCSFGTRRNRPGHPGRGRIPRRSHRSPQPAKTAGMDAFDTYAARQRTFKAAAAAHARRAERLSRARVATFGVAFVLAVLGMERDSASLWITAAIAFAVFIALVALHRRERRLGEWQERLARATHRGVMRLERRWAGLPGLPAPPGPAAARAAEDLDVFGTPALTQLLGAVAPPGGRDLVGRGLIEPDPPGEIPERQEAVRALAGENDWRDALDRKSIRLN